MTELSEAARQARNAARREYYRRNRESVAASNRKWRQAHPEKVKEYNNRYWEKKAIIAAESEVDSDGC